ncbi:hypothetical protein EV175_000200 [Coemansia sp. RSA 1933]|nr:hypothetical protein EV175_000200 [Coemansia sp. RSA 1933]
MSNEIVRNSKTAEAQAEQSKLQTEKLDTCYELLQKLQLTMEGVEIQARPSAEHQTSETPVSRDSANSNGFKKQLDLPVLWPTLEVSSSGTSSHNANSFLDEIKMCLLIKGWDFDEAGPRAILANIDRERKLAFISHCNGQLPTTWKEACKKFLEIDPLTVTSDDALARIQGFKMDIFQPFSRFIYEFEWLREIAQLDPKDEATYDLFVKCLCGPLANMAVGIIQGKLEKGVDHIEKLYRYIRFAENEFYMLVKDDSAYQSWVTAYRRFVASKSGIENGGQGGSKETWWLRRYRNRALAVAFTAAAFSFVLDNYETANLVAASLGRSAVAAKVTFQLAWDYYRNFPDLPPENDERFSNEERQQILETRSAVHLRSAEKVKRALMKNGGVYIKLGQHISAMQYVLPMEWCTTMQVLQDQNTASSLEDVNQVIKADVGQSIDDLFSSFDPNPIGVASLAQVHRAVLRASGEEVAVKVQHPMVRKYSDIDIATVTVMFEFIHSIFPDFKFMWLSTEMQTSLPQELDFHNDKSNAEKVVWEFAKYSDIPLAVPKMIQASERVLIMEYVKGRRCDDLAFLRKHNIDPELVSREIGRTFAEMTFVHGFLHCDPHPGNLFVRPRDKNTTTHGYNFDLVLLDHGLYRQLSPRFRYEYAEMWHALMKGDMEQIKYWSRKISGTDLYEMFSTILTGQHWRTIESKSLSQTTAAAQFSMDKLMNRQPDILRHITEILASVPPVLLLVLKTNDLLRMIDSKLFSDQPPIVRQHAQLHSWLRISHYCLVAIRDIRAADINQSFSRSGPIQSVKRVAWLAFNRLRFWFMDTALSMYSTILTIKEIFTRLHTSLA